MDVLDDVDVVFEILLTGDNYKSTRVTDEHFHRKKIFCTRTIIVFVFVIGYVKCIRPQTILNNHWIVT